MWEEEFSELAKRLKASEIRELLKVTQMPDIISLAGGLPNPKSFPVEIIKEITTKLLDSYGEKMLQYGSTEGVNSFRETLANYYNENYSFGIGKDNVLITAGSQEGLYLLGKIFLNPGDTVVVEAPTYVGAITAFQSFYPNYVQVEMDDEGMNIDILEKKLKELVREGKKPKFIYTIPTFQNPAGVTMSLERRKRLLELAKEYNILVVEDSPYEELRFSGEKVPQLKALDKEGYVLYIGTLSKVLSPGMRIAFMIGNEEIIQKAVLAKQGIDLCTSPFVQYIAEEYIKGGYMREHIPKIIKLYKEKRDIMLDAIEDYFPDGVKWTRPDGGMFLWVTLPEHMDAGELLQKAIENKVVYVIGAAFYPHRDHRNTMRLNFTYPTNEQIEEGIKRLAKVIKEAL
ncbi:MAG: PLP-dependent aminotransferase family protein [Thermoplasmata archaeon]|nr:PLP-dependent aminotransferase family protein [Thermoplasmata archaeon]